MIAFLAFRAGENVTEVYHEDLITVQTRLKFAYFGLILKVYGSATGNFHFLDVVRKS